MDKRRTDLLVGVDKWKRTPSKSTKATSIEPGLQGDSKSVSHEHPQQDDPLGKLLRKRVQNNNVSWLQFTNEIKRPGRNCVAHLEKDHGQP